MKNLKWNRLAVPWLPKVAGLRLPTTQISETPKAAEVRSRVPTLCLLETLWTIRKEKGGSIYIETESHIKDSLKCDGLVTIYLY